MNLRVFFAVTFTLSVLILFNTCGQQKAEWQGTIEEVDGITFVKNPIEPMYGEDVYIIEEELSIGEVEGREEYMFSEIVDVGVDEEENIYILDFKEFHAKVFNRSGEYLRTIGKRGQGPGEIQGSTNIYITPGNEILINDRGARFLHFFTLDGDYMRSLSLARLPFISRPKVDSQNNIIAKYIDTAEVWTNNLKKFDSGLNELFDIYSFEYDLTPKVYNVYPPQCFWEIRSDDSIVWGYSDKYELKILDGNGQIKRTIIKDYVPVEITEEEKQKWVNDIFGDKGIPPDVKVNWTKNHNTFQFLNIDDVGRIYVQTYEKASNGYYYDIFDSDGRYIAKIPLIEKLRVCKKNKLYTIEEDEDGYQYVKRYKVTWNY